MMRRVVVTGLGMVSPLGLGVQHNWTRLLAGESGIGVIETFDVSDLSCKIAGQVPRGTGEGLFNVDDFVDVKDQRKMDMFIHFALAAAAEAMTDAGYLPNSDEQRERSGVMIGSGIGGLPMIYETSVTLLEKGTRRVSPFFIPSALINLASGQVSIKYGFQGPNHAPVTACATGTHAIGDAARLIAFDDADVMLAGGAEASVSRIGMAGFAAARALSTGYNDRSGEASRPFDEGRDGFVMGEGAGVVVLEELEHARARGARIYGEVIGYGMSGDAHHVTSPPPDGNGGYRATRAALKRAEIDVSDVDYLNAHGTSTPVGDEIEVSAIKRLFGPAIRTMSMSSTKSAIGHLLGAAGAVEAIYCLKAIQDNVAPPTLNLRNPTPAAEGMDLVPLTPRERKIDIAVSNSFGFGGTNASLVMRRFA